MDLFWVIVLVCTALLFLALGILIGINIGIERYWEIAHGIRPDPKR